MKSASGNLIGFLLAGCVLLAIPSCVEKKHKPAPEVTIDLGASSLYAPEELNTAVLMIREKFASFAGNCELHSIRYAGDEANNGENLEWLNSIREVRSNIPPEDVGKKYVQVAEFLSDFHSPLEEGPYTWELDMVEEVLAEVFELRSDSARMEEEHAEVVGGALLAVFARLFRARALRNLGLGGDQEGKDAGALDAPGVPAAVIGSVMGTSP